jgi:hypothetical protein
MSMDATQLAIQRSCWGGGLRDWPRAVLSAATNVLRCGWCHAFAG